MGCSGANGLWMGDVSSGRDGVWEGGMKRRGRTAWLEHVQNQSPSDRPPPLFCELTGGVLCGRTIPTHGRCVRSVHCPPSPQATLRNDVSASKTLAQLRETQPIETIDFGGHPLLSAPYILLVRSLSGPESP